MQCMPLLLFGTVILLVTDVIVVYQVAEGLRRDGHHVGKDDSAVTAASEDQLVVRVVVADVPHPAEGKAATEMTRHSQATPTTRHTASEGPTRLGLTSDTARQSPQSHGLTEGSFPLRLGLLQVSLESQQTDRED